MKQYSYLDRIDTPEDLRRFPVNDLKAVADDVRDYLIDTLAEVGGHFASNLGVVELTVALHYVLNTPKDRLIWDVGHQIYPHKILTGRKHRLRSVRRYGGLSGFPKREESEYDLFNTGHAGTSISQVIGEALARDVKKEDYRCFCVIGDASMTAGMALEALNHGGHVKSDCVVILNDNDMSISHAVGALNHYLNQVITSNFYNKSRRLWYKFLALLPLVGAGLRMFSRRMERVMKNIFIPGSLFEDLGFRYIGPVDGHNMEELVEVLMRVKHIKGPILVHVYTQKGKGYQPAESNPIKYHSVTTFNRKDGTFVGKSEQPTVSYSQIVGDTLTDIFSRNDRAVAITPAMIEGSGLRSLADKYPDRVYDVGIAEQHAVALAGGMASGGIIPYLCIYSTFLVRGLDQLIEDVALMRFPVRIVIDRAGCVGPDGETHQGLYDIGYLHAIPEIRIYAPTNGAELKAMLLHMEHDEAGPLAVRFPKGDATVAELNGPLPDVTDTKPERIGEGTDLAIVSIGVMKEAALALQAELKERHGINASVIAIRWVRPIDLAALNDMLRRVDAFVFVEDSYRFASGAMCLLEQLDSDAKGRHIQTFAFPDVPIEHGTRGEIFHHYGISVEAMREFLVRHPKMKRESGKVSGRAISL
ncbi:1-deoxy-D-xylulose-5-phosphate synthase [Leptonema illini]|uniref:1-deoxy-D-xylulose-5-phosphate synthase n=1 Tax=Leptonema illini DSM 21528 TaxID=929563 RepID=H2CID5_9LEPT|nr:1-deoxy-D-xylulose-5-phosphate synthase [Leptonema illini]EHQ05928.1 1-deoxy-D-xylulose-5-phosphate synthase [Leptonema illini DSM 21528]